MNWLNKLDWKYGKYAIPNLMLYITTTMLFVAIFDMVLGFPLSSYLALDRSLVARGQIWRLLTFIVIPPASSILTLLLGLYFYYFVGSGLESAWGSFRFNVYYLCGMVGTILAALITGYGTNTYLNLSLFLAFAQLYPDHQVLLFFIIPVKMKYLAYVDWAFLLISLIFSNWYGRAAILASLLNFFLFFGGDFIHSFQMRNGSVQRNFRREMRRNGQNRW